MAITALTALGSRPESRNVNASPTDKGCQADSWKPGRTSDIAWESNQLARAQIYQALGIPVEPCEPEVNSCVHAPGGPVALDDAYMNKAATIAGEQLAKAGFRLASLLNGIWPK